MKQVRMVYFCTKCCRIHVTKSGIGKRHFKYNSQGEQQLKIGIVELNGANNCCID